MPHLWAVHDAQAGTLVGFAMISDNIPPPIDDDLVGPYYLWKLLIDHRCQRRGYGAATLDAVVTTRGRGPALRCSTPAARTALARRAGLPPPRLHRHRPGHVGRERPRTRPRAARLTGPRSAPPPSTCTDHAHLRAGMKGALTTQIGGSARVIHSFCCPVGGRPASPRKSQTKSQRRPTSGDAQRRQAIVEAGQVPTERH